MREAVGEVEGLVVAVERVHPVAEPFDRARLVAFDLEPRREERTDRRERSHRLPHPQVGGGGAHPFDLVETPRLEAEHLGVGEDVAPRHGVIERDHELAGGLGGGERVVGPAEVPLGQRQADHAHRLGVLAVQGAVDRAELGPVAVDGRLEVGGGQLRVTVPERADAGEVVALDRGRRVVVAAVEERLGVVGGAVEVAGHDVGEAEPAVHGHVGATTEPVRQHQRAFVGVVGGPGRVAVAIGEDDAERLAELELGRVARLAAGDAVEERDGALQRGDGVVEGEHVECPRRRVAPRRDGVGDLTRLLEVPCESRADRAAVVFVDRGEPGRDRGVQSSAPGRADGGLGDGADDVVGEVVAAALLADDAVPPQLVDAVDDVVEVVVG